MASWRNKERKKQTKPPSAKQTNKQNPQQQQQQQQQQTAAAAATAAAATANPQKYKSSSKPVASPMISRSRQKAQSPKISLDGYSLVKRAVELSTKTVVPADSL